MGELRDRVIIQSRIWLDGKQEPIPPYDYDYSYPITVYDAVKRTMEDDSTTLGEELSAIYRLINGKQDQVGPGVPGNIMTWTGMSGQIGSMEVVRAINSDPALRSHQKVPSERAIGDMMDTKVPLSAFNAHVSESAIHITDVERNRWNSMAPLSSLQAHIGNSSLHITEAERGRWNAKADQSALDEHVYNTNNPHSVTAHQVGTYTRREIDEMFSNIRESFFNYLNVEWDDRSNQASLVEYHPANWNPNFVLAYGDELPDVADPTLTYFALRPATDYAVNETQDCIIYCKRPGLTWQEVGFQAMNIGDMVIRYPDTRMYIWMQGRFMQLFTDASVAGGDGDIIIGSANSENMWRPSLNENGELIWEKSKETEPPPPMYIKGQDGYTPVKGVDYDDGKDGEGVAIGGRQGDVLVKLTDENFDTTWKSLLEVLGDLVLAGGALPDGIVHWDQILGRPVIYDEPGENTDGVMTQRATTKRFDILTQQINQILERIDGPNGTEQVRQNLYDHLNDFNNPHRVTPAQIGAVPTQTFLDHTQNFDNPHNVTADQLGLGNVNNTADLDKPISNAVQEALQKIILSIGQVSNNVDQFNYISTVVWDTTRCTLTFTYRDGTEMDVIIPISDIFQTIYFDEAEKELVIVLPDGNENRINIASLIKTYYGSISDNIQVVIEDNNVIKATVIPGSIGELEIVPAVHLRGSPTTLTQPITDKSTRIATTEYVKSIVIDNLISYEVDRPLSANMGRILNQRKVDIEDVIEIINDMEGVQVIDNLDSTSPQAALSANMGRYLDLTKAPRVHTSPQGSTFGRATISLFGHARAGDVDPLMDGTVFRGTDDGYFARADHRHPTDETRAPMHWPDVAHDQYSFTGEPRSTLPPDDSNDDRIVTTEWVRRNSVGVAIGDSDTPGYENIKVVTLRSDFMDNPVFIRQSGSSVSVVFTQDDIAEGLVMLDVQGSGPARVTFGGIPIVNGMIKSNHSHLFTFDGQDWRIQNPAGIHTLEDSDNSNAYVSSEWVRRNSVGINFGVCSTSGSEPEKVVTLKSTFMEPPVFFLRQIGSAVAVTFVNEDKSGHSDENVTTLNVEGTGAAKVIYGGKYMKNSMLGAGYTHLFVFDGTYWQLINPVAGTGLSDDRKPDVDPPKDEDPEIYTITFNPCGGTVNPTVTSTNSTGRLGRIPIPTRSGFNFVGWFTGIDDGDKIDLTYKFSGDTTIYARWDEIRANQITITFDPMGGTVYPETKVIDPGQQLGVLPRPEREGYTFAGWFTEKVSGGQVITNASIYTQDATIYARWAVAEEENPINKMTGYKGTTTAGDGIIDANGNVNHIRVDVTYERRENGVRIEVSKGENDFVCQMPNLTYIRCFSPKVISAGKWGATIQFQLEDTYAGGQPISLMYARSSAYIKIIELDENGNDIDNNEDSNGKPVISTALLPNGTQGTYYSRVLTATGDSPMVWSILSGALPDGLTLDSNGTINGTPTVVGKFSFTVQVINNSGTMTSNMAITIEHPAATEEDHV